jgi:hypothetical protein
MKLNKALVIENLGWRLQQGTLAAETAVLEIMLSTMSDPGSKYSMERRRALLYVPGDAEQFLCPIQEAVIWMYIEWCQQ